MKFCRHKLAEKSPDKIYLVYNDGGLCGTRKMCIFHRPDRKRGYMWGSHWYELDEDEKLMYVADVL